MLRLTLACYCLFGLTSHGLTSHGVTSHGVTDELHKSVAESIDQAITYFDSQVAFNGGFVYYYSPDLKIRLGEGVASPTQIWVQPPGTPTVGLALLNAYQATGQVRYLKIANKAANALIYRQLKSGGWTNSVDFNPDGKPGRYRNGKASGRNFSTLDDGISQTAIRFLIRCDAANEFANEPIREAVQTALSALLAAQFRNGGFPQGWDEKTASEQPILKASYPTHDWKTEGRIKEYWNMYTLNDGLAGTVIETLLAAHEVYGGSEYLAAAKRFGDFLILAQMPEPQPAWAQQYSYNMHPIWARKFEPPAIASRESLDVIQTLLQLHSATGESKYLAPIPSAIRYLKSSVLSDGQLARYYELRSNKPLYLQLSGRQYVLTYVDANLPKHYGWKVENRLNELESLLERSGAKPIGQSRPSADEVRRLIAQLDDQGRWLSRFQGEALTGQPKFKLGEDYISSQVFSDNVNSMAAFLNSVSSN